MVDEFADADSFRKFGHSAKMIAVPMSRDQMIDLSKVRILRRGHDAICIPRSGSTGISGINEKGFALRRYHKRGVPTLHIDDVNVQCFCRARLSVRKDK